MVRLPMRRHGCPHGKLFSLASDAANCGCADDGDATEVDR